MSLIFDHIEALNPSELTSITSAPIETSVIKNNTISGLTTICTTRPCIDATRIILSYVACDGQSVVRYFSTTVAPRSTAQGDLEASKGLTTNELALHGHAMSIIIPGLQDVIQGDQPVIDAESHPTMVYLRHKTQQFLSSCFQEHPRATNEHALPANTDLSVTVMMSETTADAGTRYYQAVKEEGTGDTDNWQWQDVPGTDPLDLEPLKAEILKFKEEPRPA